MSDVYTSFDQNLDKLKVIENDILNILDRLNKLESVINSFVELCEKIEETQGWRDE